MCPLEDLAAKLGMDPMTFFLKNIDNTGPRANIYREEFTIADELMGWKKSWHPRGDKTAGPVKRGMGLSIHTWGGRGHASDCDLTVHPDGAVEIKMGTQDLGTGTRTTILMVAAETLGLPINESSCSSATATIPSPAAPAAAPRWAASPFHASRLGAALQAVFAKVAPALNAKPEELAAKDGKIFVAADPSRSLTWKEACASWAPCRSHARPQSRQGPSARSHQQRRRRRADGRCLRRYRNRIVA